MEIQQINKKDCRSKFKVGFGSGDVVGEAKKFIRVSLTFFDSDRVEGECKNKSIEFKIM